MFLKKHFLSILMLMCVFCESLSAYLHTAPGKWMIEGEFLYLLPSVDDTFYVLEQEFNTSFPATGIAGKRRNHDFDFHPGFRVGAGYSFCNCNYDLQIYYSRLHVNESESIEGQLLAATVGSAQLVGTLVNITGTATSDLDLLYHRVDGYLGTRLFCCRGFNLYVLPGIEFAFIRFKEDYDYTVVILGGGFVDFRSKMWGIGPQFGFELDYELCRFSRCCPGTLGFVFSASGSLLASRSEESTRSANIVSVLNNTTDEHTWRIVPALHARAGFSYTTCFSCYGAILEIGYEFDTYLRALTRIEFPNDIALSLSNLNYNNLNLQGLYVTGAITF